LRPRGFLLPILTQPTPGFVDSAPPRPSISQEANMEYGHATQNHTYHDVTGLVIVPRAAGDPVVVELHQSYGTRNVSFSYARQNRPPEIPKAGDLDYDTYVGGAVSLPTPVPNQDGDGYHWLVTGEYVYLQDNNRMRSDSTGLDTGAVPFPTPLQDQAAAIVSYALNGTEAAENTLAQQNSDSFPWPFTRYPSTLYNTGLIV